MKKTVMPVSPDENPRPQGHRATAPRTLVLFNYDWDRLGFGRWSAEFPHDHAGFDLFSFPSNARLPGFDLTRFVDRLARRAPRAGWQAVTSNHEQFGALAAALLAERMGWPGTPVDAVLACQHKLHARHMLQQVAPEANTGFELMASRYGEPVPDDITYPVFVKPVKAAFSVLARKVRNRDELAALARFGAWELWVIRHLVEPFERIAQARLPEAGSAHRMLLETPVTARQYNLDGYVFDGELRELGIVESVMYPGTQAFMRFIHPCALPADGRSKALDVARRFLAAAGFTHGLFNMEFFYDAATDKLTVIEFNPRMAAQFSDLYLRVDGIDLHRVALELAHGRDPALLPRAGATAGVAASFVYRSFDPAARPPVPTAAQQRALAREFPDAMLFCFPKGAGQIARDFKWLGSYRYGILHLGGRDAADLALRCAAASTLLGWPSPCSQHDADSPAGSLQAIPAFSLDSPR
jgi:biotin carboxylase